MKRNRFPNHSQIGRSLYDLLCVIAPKTDSASRQQLGRTGRIFCGFCEFCGPRGSIKRPALLLGLRFCVSIGRCRWDNLDTGERHRYLYQTGHFSSAGSLCSRTSGRGRKLLGAGLRFLHSDTAGGSTGCFGVKRPGTVYAVYLLCS